MSHRVYMEINRIANQLIQDQSANGAWHYPFEAGIASDCSMIILLRTLEINDEEFIQDS